jgi:purine-cytosine permease-like protein
MMLLGLAVARKVAGAGTLGIATAIRDLVGGDFLGAIALVAIYLAAVAVDVVNDHAGSLSVQAAARRQAVNAAVYGFNHCI